MVSSDGTVYVATAVNTPSPDGKVYAINPSTGQPVWPAPYYVSIGQPIEASIAIGLNGWLYVATRFLASTGNGTVVAISPGAALVNPSTAVQWTQLLESNPPGFVASPVIDQLGFVYACGAFSEAIWKLDPVMGTSIDCGRSSRGLVQTPAINQDGLIIVGTSMDPDSPPVATPSIDGFTVTGQNDSAPDWSIANASFGNFYGAPAIRCADGATYLADDLGKVWKLGTTRSMMAGIWPTFQCGNRRAGKEITYSFVIAQLPAFFGSGSGYFGWTDVSDLDQFGNVVGQAYGYYTYPNGSDLGFAPAVWHGLTIQGPKPLYPGPANAYASGINALGDICGYFQYAASPVAWPAGLSGVAQGTNYFPLPLPTALSLGSPANNGYATRITSKRFDKFTVGYCWNSTETDVVGWTTSDGGSTWVPAVLGTTAGNAAYAYAISENVRAAGKAKFASGGQFHALVTIAFPPGLDPNTADKGTLGGTSSEAWDVRDESGSVGWSYNSAGHQRAFFLQNDVGPLAPGLLPPAGTGNELPGLTNVTSTTYSSAALGVNLFGQVVGWAQNNNGASRAFLFKPGPAGGMIDLNALLPGGSLWVLTSARAINDAGTIVGTGTYNGQSPRSWILYPTCQE